MRPPAKLLKRAQEPDAENLQEAAHNLMLKSGKHIAIAQTQKRVHPASRLSKTARNMMLKISQPVVLPEKQKLADAASKSSRWHKNHMLKHTRTSSKFLKTTQKPHAELVARMLSFRTTETLASSFGTPQDSTETS